MKRITAIFLTVLLVMTSAASLADEPFSLHAGTHFGMTAEEVIEAEKGKGNLFSKNDQGNVEGRTTILDNAATITYMFDQEGKLRQQRYAFKTLDITALAASYEKVYGRPDCTSTSGETLILPESSFTGFPSAEDAGHSLGGPDSYLCSYSYSPDTTYYQWLLEKEEGYVAIEVYGKFVRCKVTNHATQTIGALIFVDYRIFDKEAVQTERQEQVDKLNDI